jgi:hypothetical protein
MVLWQKIRICKIKFRKNRMQDQLFDYTSNASIKKCQMKLFIINTSMDINKPYKSEKQSIKIHIFIYYVIITSLIIIIFTCVIVV